MLRDEIAAKWLLSLRSPNTAAAYKRDILDWFAFCDSYGQDPLDSEQSVVDGYRHFLEAPNPDNRRAPDGLSPATVARKMCAISSYYDWIMASPKYAWALDRNPAKNATRPEVADESTTRTLNLDETRKLREAAGELGGTDGLLVRVLLGTGIRISEACSLDTRHLETEDGHRVITVRRKGGRHQRIPLPRDVAEDLDEHVGDRTGPIFLRHGQRLTRQQGADSLRRVVVAAGFDPGDDRISPHSLRHAAATLMLNAKVPIRDVQRLLGHKDTKTTSRYDRAKDRAAESPVHLLADLLQADPR